MDKISIYHNPKCSKSRDALALIRHCGLEPEIIDYLKTPPSKEKLYQLLSSMKLSPHQLIRRATCQQLHLDADGLTDEQLIEAMIQNPTVINRPIVETPLGVCLARPLERLLEILPVILPRPFTKADGEIIYPLDKKENRMSLLEKIRVTQAFLESKGVKAPEFGLILGSGLGDLAEEIENAIVIDYADIPNWGNATVVGHAGKLVYGDLAGRKVLALQGRFHFYEGNALEVVTFPVRVMKALGCEGLLVTNAAGGIGYGPGTLMAITDHINLTGQNPLIGENLEGFGPRFPDLSQAYTPSYLEKALRVAQTCHIKLEQGVYLGVTGPSYETPAEIRAFQTLGAHAVGMSTVPEVIVAAHSGLKVLGISAITNHAAGFQSELNHEEVVEVTNQIKADFKRLIQAILAELH